LQQQPTASITAALIILLAFTTLTLWTQGGYYRLASHLILRLTIWQLITLSLTLLIVSKLDHLTMAPFPWLLYRLVMTGNQTLIHHLEISYIALSLTSLLITLIAMLHYQHHKQLFGRSHFASLFEIAKAGLFNTPGIILAKKAGSLLRLPGHEGVLVVAPTGSGKTTSIAIPNLIDWQGSVVVNDLKGELYQTTAQHRHHTLHQPIYRFAPGDEITCRYNPFDFVSPNTDLRIRDIQLIANTLIPGGEGPERFWSASSRDLFQTLALYLFESNQDATLARLHDISKTTDISELFTHNMIDKPDHYSTTLISGATAFLSGDERTRKNILTDLHSRLSLWQDPLIRKATSGNDIPLTDLRRKPHSIYLQMNPADRLRLAPLLTLFWAQLIQLMTTNLPANDEPETVLALLDEFPSLARLDQLKDGLAFLRAYHLRPIVIVQYLSQLDSTYGHLDAQAFKNTKAKIIFTLNDIREAEFFAKSFGNTTHAIPSYTRSTPLSTKHHHSHSTHYQATPLIRPEDILRLNKHQALIMLEGQMPIKAKKSRWYHNKNMSEALR